MINRINATLPKKWRLLAACLPPKIFGYHGKRALIDGDIAAPVITINGPNKNTTPKYINCCIGLQGSPGGGKLNEA